jgi:PAS domain S-box-containing protein
MTEGSRTAAAGAGGDVQRDDVQGSAPRDTIETLIKGGIDESLFRAHFENLPGPAYIWRREGSDFKLVACNKAAVERVRTMAREFVVGCSAAALQQGLDFVGVLENCLVRGRTQRLEIDYQYRSGIVRRLSVTLVPIHSDHVVHHTEDITERHESEQALRGSEARSRALMDAHPDMLMRVARDGMYLDAHVPEPVTRSLGFRAEHFVGKRVDELYDEEFSKLHALYRARALETGGVQKWEFTRIVNGQRRFVEARFVRSGEDEVMVTVTDVTDRVDLERQIVSSVERERYHIGHDLHDGLGQILTGVKLMLEPLRKKLPARESLDGRNLQQAVDLINQAIAQTSELARGLSPVPREAGVTLRHALEQLASRSQAVFGVACRVHATAKLDQLNEESANNLYRIAQEAVTNAVKHGKATEVNIRAKAAADGLTLAIEDNGIGFKRTKSSGGGMGMHIMRYRARAIGGELTALSRPSGGAVVWCFCPFPSPPPLRPRTFDAA